MTDEIVVGMEVVLYNLKLYDQEFHRHTKKGIVKAAKFYSKKLTQHTTKRDHSPQDLRRLGHPYAARHGKIRRLPGHGYSWQVHRQNGKMSEAQFIRRYITDIPLSGGVTMFRGHMEVGFDPNDAPHVNYVIKGTRKMLKRPVVGMLMNKFHKKIKKIIITEMGRGHTMAWGKFRKTTA